MPLELFALLVDNVMIRWRCHTKHIEPIERIEGFARCIPGCRHAYLHGYSGLRTNSNHSHTLARPTLVLPHRFSLPGFPRSIGSHFSVEWWTWAISPQSEPHMLGFRTLAPAVKAVNELPRVAQVPGSSTIGTILSRTLCMAPPLNAVARAGGRRWPPLQAVENGAKTPAPS